MQLRDRGERIRNAKPGIANAVNLLGPRDGGRRARLDVNPPPASDPPHRAEPETERLAGSGPPDLPGYAILETLGSGGMGIVHRARQLDIGRDVALKELRFGSRRDLAARFLQEARIGGSLTHANIIALHQYFEHDGTAFIAMELAERGPLTPLIGTLTVPQSIGVLEALLGALACAGAGNIVHRDPQAIQRAHRARRHRQGRRLRHR